ncbi:hypothetical protein VNI00_010619 [Paramarasmius palmivorus]|uniref:DyP dimeric alpha+beta barrel domain-containing protein n=1 Tax=Paramarasmius palmivorus TaxID=297713 RepID=A0AAW0CIG2_9AGAR
MQVAQVFPIPILNLLARRALVPFLNILLGDLKSIADDGTPLPNLNNVQGDPIFMFPKRWEQFMFFKITDVAQFRKALSVYAPMITSAARTALNIGMIDKSVVDLDIVSYGFAITKSGLKAMGISEQLKEPHFDQGSLVNEKTQLGDMREYDPVFNGNGVNDGVILVTAGTEATCKKAMDGIQAIFKNSVTVLCTYGGHARAGAAEHFGFRDGISQPALKGIVQPRSGQRVVNPGVVVLGYPGDPVYDKKSTRPAFTKEGSFMVFRKLEQNVLFLEDYTNQNWSSVPADVPGGKPLDEDERKKLFEARLLGRFKSGVPLALSPYREDTKYLQPDYINNFDYTEPNGGCPFSAHVRKTAPRQLQPIVSKEYLDASVIVRAGIPYGDEISDKEREDWAKLSPAEKENAKSPRGLFFVCYQSSIDNGFFRQQVGFANNDYFPITGLVPQKIGQDPILGGPKPVTGIQGEVDISQDGEVTMQVINKQGEQYEVDGFAKKIDPSVVSHEQKFFVTSRGGEYYFVPSISTVKSWGTSTWL